MPSNRSRRHEVNEEENHNDVNRTPRGEEIASNFATIDEENESAPPSPRTPTQSGKMRNTLAHSRPSAHVQQIQNKEAYRHHSSTASSNSSGTASSSRKAAPNGQSSGNRRPQAGPGAFAVSSGTGSSMHPNSRRRNNAGGENSNRKVGATRMTWSSSSSSGKMLPNWRIFRNFSSQSNADNDDVSLTGADDNDRTGSASATTPPVFQSIDILPSAINNVQIDAASAMAGDQTVYTSASMSTAGVVNSSTVNRQRAARGSQSSSIAGADSDTQRTTETRMVMNEMGEMTLVDDTNTHSSSRWCNDCGSQQTHIKERYGPFGILFRMVPQTIQGYVYRGYCLCCRDGQDLRELCNDPHIPDNLPRYNIQRSALHMLQQNDESFGAKSPTKQSQRCCRSVPFQIACLIIFVIIIGASIAVGILASDKPKPFESASDVTTSSTLSNAPSSAPVSLVEWNKAALVTMENVVSFGYNIELSQDGNVLAVTSPAYDGSRGRLDMFRINANASLPHLNVDMPISAMWDIIGEPIIGDLTDDQLGLGMDLSGDGQVVAVGLPGNSAGMVQVYTIDLESSALTAKGESIAGPVPLSKFGYSVSLNFDGSRLFIGAPEYGKNPNEIYGLIQAYDFNGNKWVQLGNDILGEIPDSRFGHSLSTNDSGDKVVVGAPLESGELEEEGGIGLFYLDDFDWVQLNRDRELKGTEAGSQLGNRVSMHRSGNYIAGGGHEKVDKQYHRAGMIRSWQIDVRGIWGAGDPLSGTYEEARLGYDLDFDLKDIDISSNRVFLTMIASAENRDNQAGSTLLANLEFGEYETIEFAGPELGDAVWMGKGPSVAMAEQGRRIAVGYESIMADGISRSEIRVYDNGTI